MERKIFERKHPKNALFMAGLLIILTISLAALDVIIMKMDYLPSFYRVLLLIFNTLTIFVMLFTIWLRAKRYHDLCIKGQPAVVITDNAVEIYSPFGENTITPWEEIEVFEAFHSWNWNTCRPIYKDERRNKHRYFKKAYIDLIRLNYLDVPEKELLDEFRKQLY
jgi:hypothetical protein